MPDDSNGSSSPLSGPAAPDNDRSEVRPASGDADLLLRITRGDASAAEELVDRHSPRLLRAARARISSMFSARFDPEDIVQSTFRSFFRRARTGSYEAPRAGDLFNLLIVIALRKVRARAVEHQAACRDVRRSGEPVEQVADGDDDRSLHELLVTIDEVCRGLGESHRRIVMLRLEGYTIDEIAGRSERSRRTVERALHEFRAVLGEYFAP
ncbi:MAG TPA: hypothetical protein DCQ98_14305 [Planctomycetaceae bacterium]|nr:hypothetical protein [Planctomycetaceae bacterium]HRF00926.1 sigma-70 family RNA polymerase sigma factor [Pirellulaceae bacterium]